MDNSVQNYTNGLHQRQMTDFSVCFMLTVYLL